MHPLVMQNLAEGKFQVASSKIPKGFLWGTKIWPKMQVREPHWKRSPFTVRAFLSMFFVVTYTDPGTNNPIKAQCFNKKTHINSIPMTKTSLIKQDLKQKMAHGLRLNIPRATVETYLTTMILNSLSLFPNYVFSPKRLTLLSSKTPWMKTGSYQKPFQSLFHVSCQTEQVQGCCEDLGWLSWVTFSNKSLIFVGMCYEAMLGVIFETHPKVNLFG